MRSILLSSFLGIIFLFCLPLLFQAHAQYATPTPVPTYRIDVIVFQDANRDGVYNGNDQPLWNQGVTLNGTTTNYTDGSGYTNFQPLNAGTYYVGYSPPSGYAATPAGGTYVTVPPDAQVVYFAVTIPPAATITPNPPSIICSGNNAVVSLNWNAVSGATWYSITDYDYNPSTGLTTPTFVQGGASTSYTNSASPYSPSQNGHVHWYTVDTYYNVGSGVYSQSVSSGVVVPDCSINAIYAVVFQDVNRDGIYNGNDQPLWNQAVTLNGTTTNYTSDQGVTYFYPLPDGTYFVSYATPTGYTNTTPAGGYVTIPPTPAVVYFGIAIPPAATITPDPPTITCAGNSAVVSLNWNAVSGATWYSVYDYDYNPATGTTTPTFVQGGGSTSYTNSASPYNSGQIGHAHWYVVNTYYNVGSGVYSGSVSQGVSIPDCRDVVTGTVFLDNNRNGVWDSGEQAYTGGATITFSGGSAVNSNGSGVYTTGPVGDGTYTLSAFRYGYMTTTPQTTVVLTQRTTTLNFGITNVLQPACNSSYTNNGRTAPGVYRPSNSTWYLSDAGTATTYLQSGDLPVPGDYDGDGFTNIAIYRPSTGNWTMNGIGTVSWPATTGFTVPGDYDGDGKSDIAVWNPYNGNWYINTTPNVLTSWGGGTGYENDIPVPADYDGDGKTDLTIYRPSTGDWYIRNSSTGATSHYVFGGLAYMPVPGDYNNDGYVEPAIYASATGYWTIVGNPTPVQFGGPGYTPVPGDYNGDGYTDIAVWNSTNGQWSAAGIGIIANYGAGSDIPVACTTPTNAYHISGNVSLDYDNNGSADAASAGITVTLTGGGITPRTTTTDGSGNYTFTNVRPRGTTTYTVTVTNPNARYQINPSTAQSIPVGPNQNSVNFRLVPRYQISGVIFNDVNKNKLFAGESAIQQAFTVHIINSSSVDTPVTATNGVFSSGTVLPEGTYRVRIQANQIPAGYSMTYPDDNAGDPYFDVTVGRNCPSGLNGNLNATCSSAGLSFTAYDVQNVDFGMSNYVPTTQVVCGDWRNDGGISENIPATMGTGSCSNPNAGAYASIPATNVCTDPGILFSGNSTPYYGTEGGSASAQGWQVGNSGYPESYAVRIRRTSYAYMQATLRQSSITPLDLSDNNRCGAGGIGNCTLDANLVSGIYIANGNLTLNAFTVLANKSYIFLVNGDLRIAGAITTPLGASNTFSVSGNIYVNQTIGVSNVCSQACNVEGWFSSDHSFTVEGINSCTTGADKRFNLCGGIVTNAGGTGGGLVNNRDLCADDRFAPSVSIIFRPDMILNAPEFLKFKSDIWQEVAP